jgi:hypothetical protein
MAERFKAVVLKSTQPDYQKSLPLDEFRSKQPHREARNHVR